MRAVLLVVLVACGPSASEVRTARTATYGSPAEAFVRAQRAANALYGIAIVDPQHLGFITRPFLDAPFERSPRRRRSFLAFRVGIGVRVVTLPSGRALVTLFPRAQRSLQPCEFPCRTRWKDVPLSDVWAPNVDVQHAIDRLAVAIYDGER